MARRKTLSIDDVTRVKVITFIRLSPDGRHAVVGVQMADTTEQAKRSTLWLYRREDDSFEQVTRGPADGDARWLNPRTFLFAASRREKNEEESDKPFARTRLYTMSVRGGEPRLRAMLNGHLWDMEVSPDGHRLALAYSPNPEPGPTQRKTWVKAPPPVIPSHLHWKLDGMGALPDEHPSIYLMRIAGRRWGEPEPLVRNRRFWDSGVRWASAERIVFIRRDTDRRDIHADIMLANLKGRTWLLPTPTGPVSGAAPSPDGKRLVFTGNEDPRRGGYLPTFLYIRSTNPADKSWQLLVESDGKMGSQSTLSDVFAMGAGAFKWQDGEHVVGLHSIRGRSELLRVGADPPEAGCAQVLAGQHGVAQTFDVAGSTILYAWGDYNSPGELYRLDRKRTVSRLNTSVAGRFDIAPQRWQVRTEKGVTVDTFLWATAAQLRARKHSLPLVVYVHGGPTVQTGEGAFHEYAWLAHQGYPVLTCNPRGSTGYGAEHGVAIFGNWGDRDAHDILAVRRAALRRYPQLDPQRTFIAGGSYGGYMTNWMLTRHPRVFRAGIAQRSISNHISFTGTSDFATHFARSSLGLGNIWEDPVRAWQRSPIARVADLRAPLLLIHSENDLRCPVGQAEELFVALLEFGKKLGDDVRLVLFRQESHGLSRGGKPENRRVRLQEVLNWLKKHDGPGPRRRPR